MASNRPDSVHNGSCEMTPGACDAAGSRAMNSAAIRPTPINAAITQ